MNPVNQPVPIPTNRWGHFIDPALETGYLEYKWPTERKQLGRAILLVSVLQLLFSMAVITEYGVDWRFYTDVKFRSIAFVVWLYPLWLTRKEIMPPQLNLALYSAGLVQLLILLWVCGYVIIGSLEYTANILFFVLTPTLLFYRSPRHLAVLLALHYLAFLVLYHGIHTPLEYYRTAEFAGMLSIFGVFSAIHRIASNRRTFLMYRLLQQQEKLNLVAAERQRLAQDIHDGMGGQLIGALHGLKNGKLTLQDTEQVVQQCLDDLRLIIDAISPAEGDLLASLGNLRYRMESRFKQAGIRLAWKLGQLPDSISLSPEAVLHVLRIVQECITNILKHAQAQTVSVSLETSNDHFCIEICDDGPGCQHATLPGANPNHHGLTNMLFRAKALQGEITITHNEGSGMTARLTFPIAPSTSPA